MLVAPGGQGLLREPSIGRECPVKTGWYSAPAICVRQLRPPPLGFGIIRELSVLPRRARWASPDGLSSADRDVLKAIEAVKAP